MIIAVIARGGYLEDQKLTVRREEGHNRGVGVDQGEVGQGDVGTPELPPDPGIDADATGCGHREHGLQAVPDDRKRSAAGNQTRLTRQEGGAAGDIGGET